MDSVDLYERNTMTLLAACIGVVGLLNFAMGLHSLVIADGPAKDALFHLAAGVLLLALTATIVIII